MLSGPNCIVSDRDLRGTTSRASAASSYSRKPKPFMILISEMVPGPSWKCLVMSSFVTVFPADKSQLSVKPSRKRPGQFPVVILPCWPRARFCVTSQASSLSSLETRVQVKDQCGKTSCAYRSWASSPNRGGWKRLARPW